VDAFVYLLEARLHFGDVRDLKGKRKLVKSLKDGIRQRFGASVTEIDGQDKWQRSTRWSETARSGIGAMDWCDSSRAVAPTAARSSVSC
jgi:hypothetical protein